MMIKRSEGTLVIEVFGYTLVLFGKNAGKQGKLLGVIGIQEHGTVSRFVRPMRPMAHILVNCHTQLIWREWQTLSTVPDEQVVPLLPRIDDYTQRGIPDSYATALREFIDENTVPQVHEGVEFG